MCYPSRLLQLSLIVLALALSNCAPVTKVSQPPTPTYIPVSTLTPRVFPTHTATYDPNYFPPEWLFTPTPDPNAYTISVIIDQELSKDEIAKILFSQWLNHFMGDNISPAGRLDEYVINHITIPLDQKCAEKLEGVYVALADVVLKTSLPIISNNYQHSDWASGSGNIIDEYHITKLFSAVIFQVENNFSLLVVMQVPMCE